MIMSGLLRGRTLILSQDVNNMFEMIRIFNRSLIVYYSKNRVNSNILLSNCQGGFTHDNIMMDFH